MKHNNNQQTNLRCSLLNQPEIIKSLESALITLIAANAPLTIKAVAQTSNLSRDIVRLLLPLYKEKKSERIELRCSWTEKKRWAHKAALSNRKVSQLAAHSLNKLALYIPPAERLRKEIDLVVSERVRLNNLVNQIAKWCNIERSAINQADILLKLDQLLDEYHAHDQRVMSILLQNKGGAH